MAQQERITTQNFYILNVKLKNKNTNQHLKEEDYVRLISDAFKSRKHSESSNNKHCIFRNVFHEPDPNKPKYLYGTFAQFTFIKNERWFNLDKLDLEEAFAVPDGLFPDAKFTDFVFVPKAHRFAYRVDSNFKTNPYPIKKFLQVILNEVCNSDEYVDVDVETDKSTIEKILASKTVRHLRIELNYSNQDFQDDIAAFVDSDLRNSNASKLIIDTFQKPKSGIEIKESKILLSSLHSSVSNGEAVATLLDENGKVQTIETTDFPMKNDVKGVKSSFPRLVSEKLLNLFRNVN